jgi:hypothetical protein
MTACPCHPATCLEALLGVFLCVAAAISRAVKRAPCGTLGGGWGRARAGCVCVRGPASAEQHGECCRLCGRAAERNGGVDGRGGGRGADCGRRTAAPWCDGEASGRAWAGQEPSQSGPQRAGRRDLVTSGAASSTACACSSVMRRSGCGTCVHACQMGCLRCRRVEGFRFGVAAGHGRPPAFLLKRAWSAPRP